MQALKAPEEELSIPALRTQRVSSPRSAQQQGRPSSTNSKSSASGISAETGMPSMLNVQPSQDFRRQLFKVRRALDRRVALKRARPT